MPPEIRKIAIIAGEESGQLLAADLILALNDRLGHAVKLIGVGGAALNELGLETIFDPEEIALTGITSVVKTLPKLLLRIRQTSDAIISASPDLLLLVDSPDFSLRVARRVKRTLPDLPVVKYVAPSVWAWRPGRAKKMAVYIDSILAILPFEPKVIEELGGPKTHYVGHRLVLDEGLTGAWNCNKNRALYPHQPVNLLVLPGSRSAEIKALLPVFGEAVRLLVARKNNINVTIPTLARHAQNVRDHTYGWPIVPKITTAREAQIEAFQNADVALTASGTVTLELALAGIPAISCYKLDRLEKFALPLITTWTAALPNLIADEPIVDEYYNEFVRPSMLARKIEQLIEPKSHKRVAILEGYGKVRRLMKAGQSPNERAATLIAQLIDRK